jgi:hypothetical protein
LLQELVTGHVEHACSLLVHHGAVLDAVCTEYTYASEAFVRLAIFSPSSCSSSPSSWSSSSTAAATASFSLFSCSS